MKQPLATVVRIEAWSILFILAAGAMAHASPQADFYVATNGDDQWTGRLANPNDGKTDGPFATVTRAQTAVRELRAQNKDNKPVRVLIRGGTYRLSKPIEFTVADSGSENSPTTYAAYPNENPVFSGGMPIDGWKRSVDKIWITTIPAVQEGRLYFRQLFVNGARREPARSPNKQKFRTAGPLMPLTNRESAAKDRNAKIGFRFREGDLGDWAKSDDAVLVLYHSWTTSRHHIAALDLTDKTVRFTAPSGWPIGYWEEHQRYYIENVRAALDDPGEWLLNRKTGELAYFPSEKDFPKAEAIVPTQTELLRLVGQPEKNAFIEHLRFEGLSFQHTDWNLGRDEECDGQAAAFLRTAAVFARGAKHCVFQKCEIAHTGGYALWLERGCRNNRILQCHLHDLGAGGIRIGATDLPSDPKLHTEANEVADCHIHQGGRVYHAGVGVWIGKSSNNHIHHNEIADLFYTGVSVGWSWGYAPTSSHHNRIEANHIHHIGQEELSDMGGIYTLGVSPGTELVHNHIHDVRSYSYGGWGIYPDEGSTGILIENNLVYRTKTGGFHQHYGKENVVRNNIFAFADQGQIIRSREEAHRSFTFERNIVYFSQGDLFGSQWSNGNYLLDHNIYWRTDDKPIVFPGNRDFKAWQATGQDRHSLIADPKFTDPTRGDFRLSPQSPASKLGIKAIDVTTTGPR
jgi:hypothetical protein